MKPSVFGVLAACALLVAACATEPPIIYGPAPGSVGTSAPAAASAGQIAECGHPGAAPAAVSYPGGWQARLGEVAQKHMANDELLGGPVTTEVVDRDAQPVSRPAPDYPASAAAAGREALCYALFDVNNSGVPEEILTACSSPEFNSSVFNAASTLRFSPRTVDGRTVRRMNVVYPVQYCLGG